MRKWILAIGMMLCTIGNLYAQKATYTDMVSRYIAQYRDMAMAEQKRSGIPAAITLAQGIHETVAGSSRLATMANNHFGIKCKKEWTGETFKHTDDAPDECFRKYASAAASYQDHSDYLVRNPRYAGLFKLDITDYEGWATGLKKAGYATNPLYSQALVKIIEEYHLQDYTFAALGDAKGADIASARPGEVVPEHDAPVTTAIKTTPAATPIATTSNITTAETTNPEVQVARPVATAPNPNSHIRVNEGTSVIPPYGQVTRVNGLKAVYAKKGDTPLEYAFKHDVRYERLLEINDISDRPLPFDMYLYLERKNFSGTKPNRTLKQGESLLQVAQEEGIQLKFLRAMNLLEAGEEPVPGAVLELQHRASKKPEIIASTAAKPQAPAKPAETPIATTAAIHTAAATTETPTQVVSNANTTTILEQVASTKEALKPTATESNAPTASTSSVVTEKAETVPAPMDKPVASNTTTPATEPKKTPVTATTSTPAAAPASTSTGTQTTELDELDALKAKFDRAIYTGKSTQAQTETPVASTAPVAEAPKTAEQSGASKYYVVKKGDTAFSIAKRNNITMTQLMEWNKLGFGEIKVGQKLRVQ